MIEKALIPALHQRIPLALSSINLNDYTQSIGLVIVDEVNGFTTVGAGNLAPSHPNEQINTMVEETNRVARFFSQKHLPLLAFLDTHSPGKPEPPYLPHCEIGTGEEELVPQLKWLETESHATLVRKDCINGFIGAFQTDGYRTYWWSVSVPISA